MNDLHYKSTQAREVLYEMRRIIKQGYTSPTAKATDFFGAVDETGETCDYDSEQARCWTMGGAYLKAEKKIPDSERKKYAFGYPCPHAKAACNALLTVEGLGALNEDQIGEVELDTHAPSSQKEALDWLGKAMALNPKGIRLRLQAVEATRYGPPI